MRDENPFAAAAKERPSDDPRDVAIDVIATVDREVIVNLVAREVAIYQRATVRAAEHSVFRKLFGDAKKGTAKRKTAPRSATPASDVDAFRDLFGKSFDLSDGKRLAWEKATAEQHEARAAMQEKFAAGAMMDAQLHREAANIIRTYGVHCLAEVGAVPV